MTDNEFQTRFSGIGRLYGRLGLARLRSSRVAVIGVGGVGSWAVEALARSGIGHLSLVDLDDICVTNINRQLPALETTVGRSKVEVLEERVRLIQPEIEVKAQSQFFTAATAENILGPGFDFVVDGIDHLANKCLLIAECRRRGIPLVVCGGAGGRRDPTGVRIADLAATSHDPLLAQVRAVLRTEYRFPRDQQGYGVSCVYTQELPVFPQEDGSVCAERPEGLSGSEMRLNCDSGFGAAAFVTGVFGFAAASVVVKGLTGC